MEDKDNSYNFCHLCGKEIDLQSLVVITKCRHLYHLKCICKMKNYHKNNLREFKCIKCNIK